MSTVYEPFASFDAWASIPVDEDRWAAVLDRVVELREESSGFDWLRGPLRAAAYQSGAIEGLHPGDRGLTLTLINAVGNWEAAVRAAPDGGGPEVVDYIGAGVAALDMALDAAMGRQPVTEAWIRELHAVACRPQASYVATDTLGNSVDRALAKGSDKVHDSNVRLASGDLLVFASTLDVPAEMARLVEQLGRPDFSAAHPVVQSAFAQQTLTHVHPFSDGNGRVARALGSVFLLRAASLPFFLFADERNRYLDALGAADRGDVAAFVVFVLERMEDLSATLVEQRRAGEPVGEDGSTLADWRGQIDRAAAFAGAVNRGIERAERRHKIRPERTSPLSAAAERIAALGKAPGDLPKMPPLSRDVSIELGDSRVTETLTVVMDLDSAANPPFAVRAQPSGLEFRARVDDVWPSPSAAFELRLDAWLDQVVRALAAQVNRVLRGAG